jgi:hypothetical protein
LITFELLIISFRLQFKCSGKASHSRQGEGGEDRAADERKRLGKKRIRKKSLLQRFL